MEKEIASRRSGARKFIGQVVSAAGQKTISVRVDTMKMHSKYRKSYKVSRKYAVHDEKGTAKTGDRVEFAECRPISKTKKWRLIKVLQ